MSETLPIGRNLLISAANTGTVIDWNSMFSFIYPENRRYSMSEMFLIEFCSRLSIMLFIKTAFNVNTNGLTPELSCLEKPDEIGELLATLNVISARLVTLHALLRIPVSYKSS